jgi:2-polyprenyl-3-methyl-5-hydroxy-6-metoxy-1,4-benzoquinol methylase
MKIYYQKNIKYYSDSRNDIIDFVPTNVKKMLDIGCGQGLFGVLCKEKTGCIVHGIELVKEIGYIAQQHLDKVLVGDANLMLQQLEGEKYDLITMTDVIEHILYPEDFITELKKYLTNDGKILFSIPNFRYIGNLYEIIVKKDFKYRESGILDKTHITFFTEKSFSETLNRLDFDIIFKQGIHPSNSFKAKLLMPFIKILRHGDIYPFQFVFIVKSKKDA